MESLFLDEAQFGQERNKTVINLKPIGQVKSTRAVVKDDFWDSEKSYIELSSEFGADSLQGLLDFSHVQIIFYMNLVNSNKINTTARRPRNNPNWPKIGIFAQRGKNRPNQLGLSTCKILKVEGNKLFLQGLDAVDGTPVLDIKPWTKEFSARGEKYSPLWISELMKQYWS